MGKTTLAGSVGLAAANAGAAVGWFAPTYRNSRPLWRFIERAVAPIADRVDIQRGERICTFPTGGWIGVYSADNPDSARGEAFDLAILDEAARIAEEAWTDAIQPTLADRAGRAMLISSPKGRGWFYKYWLFGQRERQTDYKSWRAPSAANPMPTIRAAARLARKLMPWRTYRQEWLAEFVEDGGLVFRDVDQARRSVVIDGAVAGGVYVMGCDWGRSDDRTILSVIDVATGNVVAIDKFSETDYATQAIRTEALYLRFRPTAVVSENNSMGGPLSEALAARNIPVYSFNTNPKTKPMIIQNLQMAFEQRAIGIPVDDEEVRDELLAYELQTTARGVITYGAPAGMHDDIVMSLALAWYGARQSGGSVFL